MANPQTQVELARQAVRQLWTALAAMRDAREKLLALGGVSFISYLNETGADGNPIHDITVNDVAGALVTTLNAIDSLLAADNGAHRTNLAKML